MALDYFSGAGHAWRRFAQIRLEDLLDQRGRERTRAYITKRIARSSWGSFERRRWKYIERLFEQGQHQSRTIGVAINHER